MTIAELHGKLNPERPAGVYERMEDLLTSDVFGTMKYVGWHYGFMNWLRAATSPDGKSYASDVLPADDNIEHVHFEFWPLLRNNREPDLLIRIKPLSGAIIQVMIEAKYFSGASDIAIAIEDTTPDRSGNQIADQVNCFPNPQDEFMQNAHIYITADDSCPLTTYDRAAEHIIREEVPLFWLNWQSLKVYLQDLPMEDIGRQEMISDLIKLLVRKDLIPFHGFKAIPKSSWTLSVGQSFWQDKSWWRATLPCLPSPIGFFREGK